MHASLDQPPAAAPRTMRRPAYQRVSWMLLLVLGAFFLVAPLLDPASDARTSLPADHLGTSQSLTGAS